MFKVGDKAILRWKGSEHDGEICTIQFPPQFDGDIRYDVFFADGKSWNYPIGALEAYTEPQPEMTAREFQSELLRMMDAHGRNGGVCDGIACCGGEFCPLSGICEDCKADKILFDPRAIEIVAKWAAEHPKPEPISAKDYKKLKAIYSLCGDCWVTASMEDNAVIVCTKQPQKVENYWICEGEFARLGFIELSCLSWQDPEPLHLTAEWLKEVEHE